ncbi:putative Polycystic kidney disease protein 1-like 2 [Homarus americanus]|uniref:Putative Polycystic kidney disease protein 1-like 2 n=1 Tax=Homarus americanus TaxID=6706 RepID=A0A8J5NEE3_HOMAM|nr:putative Polycystic kidney disease protein 1-like 2 [Homarus americanus]
MEILLSREAMLVQNVIETTKNRAKDQVSRMMEVVKMIGEIMETKSVEGEVVLAQAPTGAAMMVAKMSEMAAKNGLKVGVTKGVGGFQLPSGFCPSSFTGHSYSDSSNQLSKNTRVVSLDLYLEGEKVQVTNVSQGIIVTVPRTLEDLPGE